MSQNQNKKQDLQPNPRVTIISVVLFLLVAFFVGQQFFALNNNSQQPTDNLITSEFVQAVEQDRVTNVVYSAGDYTVSGTYYPAITAGSTEADAFNSAFSALNARVATLRNVETGSAPAGINTTNLDETELGTEHRYTSTYVGVPRQPDGSASRHSL